MFTQVHDFSDKIHFASDKLHEVVIRIKAITLLSVLSFGLFACDGGSDSSLPATPPADTVAPVVVSTEPANNTTTISIPVVRITFSEAISSSVDSNNITIWPLIGMLRGTAFVPPSSILNIDAANENKVLEIKLPDLSPNAALATDTVYLVEIRGVRDANNIPMDEACRWLFATGNADLTTVNAGNGICDTPIPNFKPEPGTLAFKLASSTVNENVVGANATILVTRTNGSDGVVTVNFATSNGSALASANSIANDYTANTGTLTFSDGDSTTKSITVAIVDDKLVESNETFNITLSGVTGGAVLTGTNPHVVTIIDDEVPQPGTISFVTPASSSNFEDSGGAVINIIRTNGSDGIVTVNYKTVNGTASSDNSDFIDVLKTVTFGNSDSAVKQFTIPVIADTNFELNEQFTIILETPTGGATLGSLVTHTHTIKNDDDMIGFVEFETTSVINVSESIQLVTLNAIRSGGTNGVLKIDYETSNGTAVSPSDYLFKSGKLSFPAGIKGAASRQTITITVINDQLVDANPYEDFFVNLIGNVGDNRSKKIILEEAGRLLTDKELIPIRALLLN